MRVIEPSLPGWRMPYLHRCHVAALNHGYRIGLVVGENGAVGLSVRDTAGVANGVMVMGNDIEYCATILFAKMLEEKLIPRSVDEAR